MKKTLLTMAMALMASLAVSAQILVPSADLPKRGMTTPVNHVMKSQASPAGSLVVPKARRLASPVGMHNPVRLPAMRQAAPKGGDMPEIYGSVIYADGWTQQNNAIGMYRIATSDQVPFERKGTARVDATGGGVAVGDTYWASYYVDLYGSYFAYTLKFDINTWVEDTKWNYWSEMTLMSTGAVYDRTTDKIYGCFFDDTQKGFVFGTVDYVAQKRVAIKALESMWSAVAITRKGQLYAIDELGDLYSVDKETGDMTAIGSTGLMATNPSSACIDPRSGRCFYAVTQGTDGSLYEIDLNTAQATLVYHFPDNQEVVGLFVPVPDVEDNAPDAVSGLQLSFPDGTLSGTVSFTCPSTTFDGQAGTGNLTYIIEANDLTVASGQASWGGKIEKEVSFSAPGSYKFKVYVANAAGNGPVAEAEMFVGNDLPLSPQLTATMTDGVVSLSWEPVTSSVNGGYIDVENISYTVTRFPDSHIVAEATRQTSVTDTPPAGGALTGFWYVVTAKSGSYASADAVSRKFWTGSLTPPYSVVFDTETKGEAFIVHDANNDGYTWSWSSYDKAFKTSFNRNADMDDWLVTPPLKLEKGKMYMFTAKMRTYLGNPLNVEIRWGSGDTPDALSEVLMEPRQIKNRNSEDYSFYLTPQADGIYYVGIHEVTSASNSWFLYVDGVTVNAGVEALIPDVADEFTVTPDNNGGKSATVSVTAPSKAVDGSILATLDRIDIMRNGAVVKSYPSPKPGAILDPFTDEVPEIGYYKYEALAYNSAGAGKKTSITVFVGANEPARPAWVKIEETATPGEVTMTWEKVAVDKDGKPLNPDLVSYTIVAAGNGDEPVIIAENIKGTSHTFQALYPGVMQSFVGYGLRASTEGGYSLMAVTDLIPVGTPYASPWRESFAGGEASYLIRSEDREGLWNIYTDDAGIPSKDGDNGMAAMFGEFYGADATLFSGKISLDGLDNPALMFYVYNIDGENGDQNEIEVSVNGGDGFVMEKYVLMWTLGESEGWYLVVVPLDKYKNKTIQFSLRAITATHKFTLVDDINVTSLDAHNLRVASINAPATVGANQEFFVTVNVENISVNEASHFVVKLFRNGKQVAVESPASLGAGDTRVVKFSQILGVADTEVSEYYAVIDYDADQNDADDTSAKKTVKMVIPNHPVPRNLAGTVDVNSVSLTWDAPDLASAVPDRMTEDFEGFESWSKTGANGWVFVDVDKAGIGQIGNFVLPGIDYNSQVSWFVTDASLSGLPAEAFTASSGTKYLSTLFCLPDISGDVAEYVTNDDWAISPLLFGGAQSISLMARSMNPAEAEESFEILVSESDSDSPADFILLKKIEKVPGQWTPYSFDLPQGVKRFAIRYNHTFGLSLGIDDVSFIPAGTSTLVLEGYNVYRDGERVNTSLVRDPSFTELVQLSGRVSYAVTAVYENAGESRLSEPLYLGGAGVDQVASAGNVTVATAKGVILVGNADGVSVTVTDIAGRVVAVVGGASSLNIPVARGIYVVNAGSSVVKVLVP